jgi:hypothetical protein
MNISISNFKRRAVASGGALLFSLGIAAFSAGPVLATSSYDSDVINDGATGYWFLGNQGGAANQVSGGQSISSSTGGYNCGADNSSNTVLVSGGVASGKFANLSGDDVCNFNTTANAAAVVSSVGGTENSPVNNFTLEAWIKPRILPATNDLAGIVVKNGSFGLALQGPELATFVFKNSGAFACNASSSSNYLSTGQKYHVVATYDGTYQKLYINGSLVQTCNPGTGNTSGNFFTGNMSNVSIYDGTVLSGTQVSAHYSDGHL